MIYGLRFDDEEGIAIFLAKAKGAREFVQWLDEMKRRASSEV